MNIGIHQSSFLPYIGYWNKLVYSDIFLDLGDFQFSPNEMYHRTFIYDPNKYPELKYFTVPIIKESNSIQNILFNEKEFQKFKESFINVLKWYKKNVKCFHWKNVYDLLVPCLENNKNLYELNQKFIDSITNFLSIETVIVRKINFNKELHKSELLVDLINQVANYSDITYLSGSGAKIYIDLELFKNNNIEVKFPKIMNEQTFFKGTIIDYLMRYSPEECFHIIKNQYNWEK